LEAFGEVADEEEAAFGNAYLIFLFDFFPNLLCDPIH
jgi:hypothetical protein